MSRHRGAPARRLQTGHGATVVRLRYGRLTAASSSLTVSAVALLGGLGVLPVSDEPTFTVIGGTSSLDQGGAGEPPRAPQLRPQTVQAPEVVDAPVPADSGSGRRVVFSEEQQRVWLVEDDETVRRTYLVSGSVTDNLHPGTYTVYSRSADAWGIDDSGTMEWFVRFTRGQNAAIGFHDIPELDGVPLQKHSQLGTPQSHGCVRQREVDAKALWRFAPLGTTVVVV